MRDVRIAPTNDRSVVGVINEFAFHGELHWNEGLRDLRVLSLRMAGMPLGPLRHRSGFPDRELAAILGGDDPTGATVIPFPGRRVETSTTAAAAKRGSVYQLKVTLLATKPPIWRRVLIDGARTIDHVHEVIQAAFGWWNYHLHEFEIDGRRYAVPDPDEDWGEPPLDERRARLDSVSAAGASFEYTYDFGDYWRHRVVVEKVLPGSEVALDLHHLSDRPDILEPTTIQAPSRIWSGSRALRKIRTRAPRSARRCSGDNRGAGVHDEFEFEPSWGQGSRVSRRALTCGAFGRTLMCAARVGSGRIEGHGGGRAANSERCGR